MSSESVSRTFIGSVVCVDLVGYSTKSVAQQITIKDAFNRLLGKVLEKIPPEDRIILDTGDGAAISFLGDPEATLAVGLALRDTTAMHAAELGSMNAEAGQSAVRIGINLGPVKLAVDLNGYPKIIGDGINVAERITSFAQPGQIAVSRSFFDMVSRLSDANAVLFRYEGVRTDKNAREHQIYIVDSDAKPQAPVPERSRTEPTPAPADAAPAFAAAGAAAIAATSAATAERSALVGFLEDRFKVGFVALIAAEGVLLAMKPKAAGDAVAAAPAQSPAAVPAPVPVPAPARAPVEVKPAPLASTPAKPAEPAVAAKIPASPAAKVPEPAPKATELKPPAPKAAEPKPEPKAPEAKSVPAKAPEVKAAPAKAPEAKAAPAKVPDAKVAPRKEDPARADPAKAATTPAPTPPPEPVREEPKPAPAPTLAATPISRAAVNFPPAAAAKSIDAGTVKARLTIDAAGRVKDVQIVESRPRRLFDEEAARSLREWRFNAGADNRTYDVEIAFQR
jgi:TonB family protein